MVASRRIAVVVAVTMLICSLAVSADAGNFGPDSPYPDAVPYADNGNHSRYYDSSFTAGARAATDWTIDYSYQPTDLYIYITSTDIHGSNDIWYNLAELSGGLLEYADCRAMQDSDECEHWHGTYDYSWWYANTQNTSGRRAVACHCFGHTVGLADGTGSFGCMNDPIPQESPYLGDHNRNHINSRY